MTNLGLKVVDGPAEEPGSGPITHTGSFQQHVTPRAPRALTLLPACCGHLDTDAVHTERKAHRRACTNKENLP